MLEKSHIPSPAEPCSVVSVGRGILMEQVQSLRNAWGDCMTKYTHSLLSSSYCWTHCALALGAKFRQSSLLSTDSSPALDKQMASKGTTASATRLRVGKSLTLAESTHEAQREQPSPIPGNLREKQSLAHISLLYPLFPCPFWGSKSSSYKEVGDRGNRVGRFWGTGDGKGTINAHMEPLYEPRLLGLFAHGRCSHQISLVRTRYIGKMAQTFKV